MFNHDRKAKLFLSTGEIFEAKLMGAPLVSSGELVFTTGMVGYAEAITDPSYCGQILIFTFPQIGNYGVPKVTQDESAQPPLGLEGHSVHLSGVLIAYKFDYPKHRLEAESLNQWLLERNVPGLYDIDTRALTQIVREKGKVFARIVPENSEGYLDRPKIDFFESKLKSDEFFDPSKYNLLKEVSVREPVLMGSGQNLVNIVDFGVKWNIVREFLKRNCRVRLVPWESDFSQFADADAWVLSNGPGDPKISKELILQVQNLIKSRKPVLGICLGHQLLALASGADTERLPYGHRSHNQPVQLCGTMRGYITSQNHGFVVVKDTMPSDWEIWFENLNDKSIEGIRHKTQLARSVQFHPEANGGPQDTSFIISDFLTDVRAQQKGKQCHF